MFINRRLFSICAAALMAVPVAAQADPAYTVDFLPDGFYARVLGNNGVLAGSVLTDAGWAAAATYANGSVTRYDSLGISDINAVSANGMFAGRLQTAGMEQSHAFIYRDGAVQDLGTYNGQDTTGLAINAAGQVAGGWYNGPKDGGFVYSGGVMTDMGTLGTVSYTWVSAMNESGVVVGTSMAPVGIPHAYMYSHGVMTDLGTPDGFGSDASAINNSGDIVGGMWELVSFGAYHAFLYSGGMLHDLGTLGGLTAAARGINDSGLVVGYVATGAREYGFLYDNGIAWDLNTLASGAEGWTITNANAINAQGQILATACDVASACRDVLLNPVSAVPEPATYAMLLVGIAVLAGRGRVKRGRARAAG